MYPFLTNYEPLMFSLKRARHYLQKSKLFMYNVLTDLMSWVLQSRIEGGYLGKSQIWFWFTTSLWLCQMVSRNHAHSKGGNILALVNIFCMAVTVWWWVQFLKFKFNSKNGQVLSWDLGSRWESIKMKCEQAYVWYSGCCDSQCGIFIHQCDYVCREIFR